MIVKDDYIINIKRLLETQRFIFCTFVTNKSFLELFNGLLDKQKLLLDQHLSFSVNQKNDNQKLDIPEFLHSEKHNIKVQEIHNEEEPTSENFDEQNLRDSVSCKVDERTLLNDYKKVNIKPMFRTEKGTLGHDMEDEESANEKVGSQACLKTDDPVKKEPEADINEEKDSIEGIVTPNSEQEFNTKIGQIMLDKTKYDCDICDKNFRTENILFHHYSEKHNVQKEIPCPAIGCPALYKKRKSLDEHTRKSHKNQKIFTCIHCDESFNLKSELRHHKKTAHDIKLTCVDCGKSFASKIKLRYHRKEIHPTEKPYSCNICPTKFLHESALETHIQNIHERTEIFTCDICNKTIRSKSNFQAHILTHSDVRNFKCDYCDKKFVSKTRMKDHMNLSHINLGRYQCDQCGYSCSSKQRLKLHSVIHNDFERNFSCIHCGALFKTDDVRKNHERTHLDESEKKYKCDECTKAFYSANKLRRHLKVHTGEMDFACSFCDKKFNQRGNLKTHLQKYHEIC